MDAATLALKNRLISALADSGAALSLTRAANELRLRHPEMAWTEVLADCLPVGVAKFPELPESIAVTTLLDDDFPRFLRHIPDPPLALFYRGSLQSLHRPAVALVGARACTHYGRNVARRLAGELARLGFVIVSGMALGIDGAAHEAALAVGGRTVAVLGSGVDQLYPRGHRRLAASILDQQGTLISEFPPGSPALPHHFPIRNRIISGLCHAVVVVEAKQRSGSLITARCCLEQGRELFAVPGAINRPTAAGPNGLIETGQARLLSSVSGVLRELKPLLGLAVDQERRKRAAIQDALARKIYDRLDAFEPVSVDCIAAGLGIAAGKAVAKLTELETLNLVERKPGQYYLRNPLEQPKHLADLFGG